MAEHRALQAGGADLDAEQVEQVVRADARDLAERLALDLVGQEARARLADGAAAAGERDAVDDPVRHAEHQRDPVAAQRVGALVGRVGVLDDPEVVGPSVVLEDVVAVEVVHAPSSVARTSQFRPYQSDMTIGGAVLMPVDAWYEALGVDRSGPRYRLSPDGNDDDSAPLRPRHRPGVTTRPDPARPIGDDLLTAIETWLTSTYPDTVADHASTGHWIGGEIELCGHAPPRVARARSSPRRMPVG